jgi:predicted DNA-binding transcriptional regulator AlpA
MSKANPWADKEQPLGVREIANELGYSRQTVSSWQQRKQFPEPDGVVGGGKVRLWKRESVVNWANATGRNKNKATV